MTADEIRQAAIRLCRVKDGESLRAVYGPFGPLPLLQNDRDAFSQQVFHQSVRDWETAFAAQVSDGQLVATAYLNESRGEMA